MTKKLFVKTFGCQMNVYDSERMTDLLTPLGYEITDGPADADMVIMNTCHIREKASEKLFSDLGRLKPFKQAKQANDEQMIIAVAGCVAQAEGAEIIKRAPYVDIVLGPQTYHRLPEMIARAQRAHDQNHLGKGLGRGVVDTEFPVEAKFDYLPTPRNDSKVATFLSVQEGCDKFCTFCVVPYTRGAEYSRPVADILRDAKAFIAQGVREITLLGQNVNAYHGASPGTTKEEWGLGRLIRALAELDGLERIRYTTSHPKDMDDDLMSAHRDVPQLMPYLHLPIQSGSDRILETMQRRHTADEYRQIIDRLRSFRPDIALSSDFIVGFPGESDKDFEATLQLVKDVTYAQAYSFKYSIRPGTPAASMEHQVAEGIKQERLAQLQDLLLQQQVAFNQGCEGQILKALIENPTKRGGQYFGRTPFNQPIHIQAETAAVGHILPVKVTRAYSHSLEGEL